ncbi:MAG: HIT family protein [Polyangiaceae bacterium]|jgi:histidine triad (HIT) family protein
MADCTFCEIVRGNIAAELIADEGSGLAFLDTRPLFPGHVLVVPRAHVETLADLSAATIAPLFTFVQRIARAVERGMRADGSLIAINNRVSQSVPHLHIHVVPRKKKDGFHGFFWPRHPYASPDEARAAADAIRSALDVA